MVMVHSPSHAAATGTEECGRCAARAKRMILTPELVSLLGKRKWSLAIKSDADVLIKKEEDKNCF
jgi:hypothetical protein